MELIKFKNFPIYIFFIILSAIMVINFPYIKSFLKKTPLTADVDKTGKIELPVSLNNRSVDVDNVYLAYTFYGPLKEVKKLPDGTEIVLETSEKDLPQFIITQKDVKIFKVGQGVNITPAIMDDLRKGSNVSISTTYNLKTHLWITRTVHIVD